MALQWQWMSRRRILQGSTVKQSIILLQNVSHYILAEIFQIVADHLIKESGVRPILHCYAVEAIMENDTIKGIITESKSGRKAILADRVIDCTGDADVAYLAGAEYRYAKLKNSKYFMMKCSM